MRSIPAIYDLDHRRKLVESFPDYAQILSYPTAVPSNADIQCGVSKGVRRACLEFRFCIPRSMNQGSQSESEDKGRRRAP